MEQFSAKVWDAIWGDLFQSGTSVEIAQMLALVAAMGMMLMVPFVWICTKTVALKERPEKRALWTASIAYGCTALLFIFLGDDFISPWFAPLVPVPGALLIYAWLLNTFRKGWVEDDEVPEDMVLENNDWRIGVALVLGVIVIAVIKTLVRSA